MPCGFLKEQHFVINDLRLINISIFFIFPNLGHEFYEIFLLESLYVKNPDDCVSKSGLKMH